jgi:hypothetical protein
LSFHQGAVENTPSANHPRLTFTLLASELPLLSPVFWLCGPLAFLSTPQSLVTCLPPDRGSSSTRRLQPSHPSTRHFPSLRASVPQLAASV